MNERVVEVRQLGKRYGELRAVDGVDFAVEAGEMFGLIGHNGAGKSTLFRMMLGLIAPSSGEILIKGEALRGVAFRRLRRRLGYLPENLVFYDNLSGLETLAFYAGLKRADRASCAALLARVGLAGAASRRVREYSKGMRQRLGLAQALLGGPSLLFLDEPTSGLDPEGIHEFYALLNTLRAEGVTIILSSHILAEIQDRVDRLAIIRNGHIEAIGTVQALRDALDLPLRLSLSLCCDDSAPLRQALAGLPVTLAAGAGRELTLECSRQTRMPLLRALTALGDDVTEIRIQEASLEDVFIGHARGKP